MSPGFAKGSFQTFHGSSVMLETLAPAEAMICAPARLNNRVGEKEYLDGLRSNRRWRVPKSTPTLTCSRGKAARVISSAGIWTTRHSIINAPALLLPHCRNFETG